MKNRFTFSLALVSLLATFALLLGACGPASTPVPQVATEAPAAAEAPVVTTEPVEITYYTFSAAPDHLKEMDQMVATFEQSHPNIKVKVETAPYADYFTALQTRIAGGDAPDTFELNYESFVSYAEKGLLLDLSSSMAADTTLDTTVYYPRANEAFSYNGMQLGLPATFSTVVLFYNKDLFDKAGLAYPTKDWTWVDVSEAAKKLTDPATDTYGVYSPIQFWEFYKKAAQNNCKFFNDDKSESLINSPECVAALETMASFEKDGVMPTAAQLGGVSNEDAFKSGKIGMLVSGIWMFSTFKDASFAWDIQVEPGMATKATHFFANSAVVFAASKHPQESYEWVKFLTSDAEVARIRVQSSWELPALNNPEFFADYLVQTPPANRQAVFDSLEFAVVPPVIARQNEMQDAVNKLLEQVSLGQLTPQEALDQAKVEIEALLQ